MIRNIKKHVNELVDYIQQHRFTLQNIPVTPTHFPHAKKYRSPNQNEWTERIPKITAVSPSS